MKEEEMKQKFPGVAASGLSLSLIFLVIALAIFLISKFFLKSNGFSECPTSNTGSLIVFKEKPNCKDNRNVWLRTKSVKQQVHKQCNSGLIFLPNLPLHKIVIDAPGEIYICLWNKDRCVKWIHTENKNFQEKQLSEIPPYSAIRLMGEEGAATISILENQNLTE